MGMPGWRSLTSVLSAAVPDEKIDLRAGKETFEISWFQKVGVVKYEKRKGQYLGIITIKLV